MIDNASFSASNIFLWRISLKIFMDKPGLASKLSGFPKQIETLPLNLGETSLYAIPIGKIIIELVFSSFRVDSFIIGWLAILGAFFTAFYSIRLLYLVFLSEPNGYRSVYSGVHDAPIRMGMPLGILAIPSMLIGFLTKDMAIGFGTNFWGIALFVKPANQFLVDSKN